MLSVSDDPRRPRFRCRFFVKIVILHYDFQGYNKLYYAVPRPRALDRMAPTHAFSIHPIAALLGPRQCGKTTRQADSASRAVAPILISENPVDIRRPVCAHDRCGTTHRPGHN